ncbi:hypothetical protein C1752_00448 [Acaryochloris thomasi RCC1774]|uniref:DUF4870 domain-containing protein n=1 Tax=Acaryochloris thomasi RCC1774 TaxID=1764569 RepID=A0A2W1JZX4_9CYAN|nr:DUF4870 domain-containing protein [Acaryochloris thomasi]PZD75442.1 hypothetical protein C1752_00448 [Acaryochloris thomasi RCC1774]
MVLNTYDSDKRRLLSSLCHGAIFFSPLVLSAGIPFAILTVSDDPVVKESAKESLNYHFNIWFYGLIAGIISFFWWTIILLPLIWLVAAFLLFMTWIVPIVAIASCWSNPDESYRYPFIFRLL